LSAVLPVLTRRDSKTIAMTARLWGVVLVANIAGRLLFAALLQIKGVFSDDVVREPQEIFMHSFSGNFIVTVVRALFAGWLPSWPAQQACRTIYVVFRSYSAWQYTWWNLSCGHHQSRLHCAGDQ
jgi:hypothetical protein